MGDGCGFSLYNFSFVSFISSVSSSLLVISPPVAKRYPRICVKTLTKFPYLTPFFTITGVTASVTAR